MPEAEKAPLSMEAQKHRLAELLRERLSPGAAHSALTCTLTGPVYTGSNSTVFRGDGSLFPFPVAVKRCGMPAPVTRSLIDVARTQFSALERVSAALVDERTAAVPRPVALIEDEGIVISEWVDGVTLTQFLQNPANPVAALERGLVAAGRWLAAFHGAHRSPAKPPDLKWAQALVDNAMASAPPGFRARSSIAEIDALLRRTAGRALAVAVPQSWMHGDFKPDNVFICDGRTVGVDIGANFVNATLVDIAYFLNHLEIAICHPRAIRAMPHRARLVAAFRSAYGRLDGLILPESWFRLSAALRLRASFQASRHGARHIYNELSIAFLMRRLGRTLGRLAG